MVVGLQLGAGPSGQSLVHWWGVEWLACLGLGLLVPQDFFLTTRSTSFVSSGYSGWLGGLMLHD